MIYPAGTVGMAWTGCLYCKKLSSDWSCDGTRTMLMEFMMPVESPILHPCLMWMALNRRTGIRLGTHKTRKRPLRFESPLKAVC